MATTQQIRKLFHAFLNSGDVRIPWIRCLSSHMDEFEFNVGSTLEDLSHLDEDELATIISDIVDEYTANYDKEDYSYSTDLMWVNYLGPFEKWLAEPSEKATAGPNQLIVFKEPQKGYTIDGDEVEVVAMGYYPDIAKFDDGGLVSRRGLRGNLRATIRRNPIRSSIR